MLFSNSELFNVPIYCLRLFEHVDKYDQSLNFMEICTQISLYRYSGKHVKSRSGRQRKDWCIGVLLIRFLHVALIRQSG